MKITRDTVVEISYSIRNQEGMIVDENESSRPLVYLHGYRHIVPGVESALDGLEVGDRVELMLGPEEAYGDRDPEAIAMVPRSAFPEDTELTPGVMFRAFRPDGQPVIFSVVNVGEEVVMVDANHPLAGQTLHVQANVLTVRPATDEEREHQHVHIDDEASLSGAGGYLA